MKNLNNPLSQLKSKGYRFSIIRNFIIELIKKSGKPLSVSDVQKFIKKKKLSANKTTVYRELELLKKEGIISEMQLRDNKRWYEFTGIKHHHHIICLKCEKVEDFTGCDSKKLINKALKQAPDFAEIINHNFDFFGLCKSCAKKQ